MSLTVPLLAVVVLLVGLAVLALIEDAVLGLRAATRARVLQDQARALRTACTADEDDPLLAETLARDLFTASVPPPSPRRTGSLRRPKISRGSAPPGDQTDDQTRTPRQRAVLTGRGAPRHREG